QRASAEAGPGRAVLPRMEAPRSRRDPPAAGIGPPHRGADADGSGPPPRMARPSLRARLRALAPSGSLDPGPRPSLDPDGDRRPVQGPPLGRGELAPRAASALIASSAGPCIDIVSRRRDRGSLPRRRHGALTAGPPRRTQPSPAARPPDP